MIYVHKGSQTKQPSLQKTILKSAIFDNQQKQYRIWIAVKYDIQRILFSDQSGEVESTAVSTLHRSIQKNTQKICNLSIYPHWLILALFLMTSQCHFSFSFPEQMDGWIDFLSVRSLFLDIETSKNLILKF